MVRRKGGRRKTAAKKVVKVHGKAYVCKPTRGSKAKYKKCILTAIRTTKITTRKGAQKAFRAAAKKCSPLLVGVKARKGVRKGKRRVRKTLPGMGRSSGSIFPKRMSKARRDYLRNAGIRGM
jgi:hypothetical protein